MNARQILSALVSATLCFSYPPAKGAEPQRDSSGVVSHIPRGPVESTVIEQLGYSHRRQILEVKFKGGSTYRYLGVPKSVYHDMLKAPSKTAFYTYNVKGYYKSYRVKSRIKDEPRQH